MAPHLTGTISTGDLNDVLGIGVAITGLSLGIFRYGMVLRGAQRKGIERATAFGFYIGLATSAAVLGYLAIS